MSRAHECEQLVKQLHTDPVFGAGQEAGGQNFVVRFSGNGNLLGECECFNINRYYKNAFGNWKYDYPNSEGHVTQGAYRFNRKGYLINFYAETPLDTPHGGFWGAIPLTASFKFDVVCGPVGEGNRNILSSMQQTMRIINGVTTLQ